MSSPRSIYASKLSEFPGLAFGDEAALPGRGRWAELFRERVGAAFTGRLIFEVGCNDAGFLTRVAAKHPDVAFVGLDWKCKAIYDAATRVTELGLQNVALIRGRAQDVATIFGSGELDEVWVFHPDPCDKPAELKNRLIAEPFLVDVYRVLRDETSTLTLKTDHPGYYQWTLALLGLPEPMAFAAARAGAKHAGAPRVRVRDLMDAALLPHASDVVRRALDVTIHADSYWDDASTQVRTADRLFAGERTAFEGRFVRKRMPIHFVELRKR